VPRQEKIEVVNEIKGKLDLAKVAILTEFQGLNVAEITELRKLFREADVEYKVYKNTLTRLAADQLGLTGIEEYLVGTTALVFSENDPVVPAKIVKDFVAKHGNFKVKAGILDKKIIPSGDVMALASIPPREILLATLLARMQGPISGLLNVVQAPIRDFVCVLKNLAEQKGKDENASDQPAEED
jgi:large subunit ribosomal protein L10